MKKAYSYLAILFLAALSMARLNAVQTNNKDKYDTIALRFAEYNGDDDGEFSYEFSDDKQAKIRNQSNNNNKAINCFIGGHYTGKRANMRTIVAEFNKRLEQYNIKQFTFEPPKEESKILAQHDNNEPSKEQQKAYFELVYVIIDSLKISDENVLFDDKQYVKGNILENIGLKQEQVEKLNTFISKDEQKQVKKIDNIINQPGWQLQGDTVYHLFSKAVNLSAFYDNHERAISLVFKGAIVVAILAIYRLLIINKNVGGITDSVKSIAWLPNILKRIMLVTWRL